MLRQLILYHNAVIVPTLVFKVRFISSKPDTDSNQDATASSRCCSYVSALSREVFQNKSHFCNIFIIKFKYQIYTDYQIIVSKM